MMTIKGGNGTIAGGERLTMTLDLEPGNYFALDNPQLPEPVVQPFTVVPSDERGSRPDAEGVVHMGPGMVIAIPDDFDATGTWEFVNDDPNRLHEAAMARLADGMTAADVVAWGEVGIPGPVPIDGEFGSMGALGPGERAFITLEPGEPGDYVLICFVPGRTASPTSGRAWSRRSRSGVSGPLPVPADRRPRSGAGDELLGDGEGVGDRDDEADVRRLLLLVAGGDGGVDADDLAVGVDQRPARVARADGGVGLDQAGQRAALGVDGPPERRHDALGHGRAAVEGERVADRHDLVADGAASPEANVAGTTPVASSSWSTAMSLPGVGADDGRRAVLAVDVHRDVLGAGHDVGVGQDVPGAVEHDAGAGRLALAWNGPCCTTMLGVIDTTEGSTVAITPATSIPPVEVIAVGTAVTGPAPAVVVDRPPGDEAAGPAGDGGDERHRGGRGQRCGRRERRPSGRTGVRLAGAAGAVGAPAVGTRAVGGPGLTRVARTGATGWGVGGRGRTAAGPRGAAGRTWDERGAARSDQAGAT